MTGGTEVYEYLLYMDPYDSDEIAALLRVSHTPEGRLVEGFSVDDDWRQTSLLTEAEHGDRMGDMVRISAERAAEVEQRFRRENAEARGFG